MVHVHCTSDMKGNVANFYHKLSPVVIYEAEIQKKCLYPLCKCER